MAFKWDDKRKQNWQQNGVEWTKKREETVLFYISTEKQIERQKKILLFRWLQNNKILSVESTMDLILDVDF